MNINTRKATAGILALVAAALLTGCSTDDGHMSESEAVVACQKHLADSSGGKYSISDFKTVSPGNIREINVSGVMKYDIKGKAKDGRTYGCVVEPKDDGTAEVRGSFALK